ncbi:hypothetical protein AB0D57_47175 [Streptomyces sp. NPDC048275]|uniref:hypothetical protein n=1 Tax=Streptomyces sp. NPDC048275 TaxID=3155629 RepID=UPI0033D8F485
MPDQRNPHTGFGADAHPAASSAGQAARAERADSEFPLEKEVADGFNDIFGALNSAVAVAEDMGPLFRQAHEHDIARHEDPRNGPEAEKGWNV